MARVFQIDDWAPASSQASTSDFSTLCTRGSEPEEIIEPEEITSSRFRDKLRSRPFTKDSDMSSGAEKMMSMGPRLEIPEDGKREGGFRGFIRRASVSIKRKQRRHSHTSHAIEDRPQTSASPWLGKLRQAASFNRHSRCFPAQCFDVDSSTDSREYLAPIPGYGNAPPIIPRGNGGEAARATAAAQNEYFFGRNRHLLSPDYQVEEDESGIGIAHSEHPFTSIVCVDFIAKLPNELAIQILEKLDHHALARTALVSKAWHQVSCDNQIWRKAFFREKSKTYAMSGSTPLGTGLGLPAATPKDNFKDLYRIRQELEFNWQEGKAEPIYLNGHLDSIYCVQFDE